MGQGRVRSRPAGCGFKAFAQQNDPATFTFKVRHQEAAEISGDLSLNFRKIFRIGFADDAIATTAFRRIKAEVCAFDERIGVVTRLQDRHAY